MDDAVQIAVQYAAQAHWDNGELLDVVLEYIDNQGANNTFADFLAGQAAAPACGHSPATCHTNRCFRTENDAAAEAEVADAIADAQGTTFQGGSVIRRPGKLTMQGVHPDPEPLLDCRAGHTWPKFGDQKPGTTVGCARCKGTRHKSLGGAATYNFTTTP